MNDKHINDGGPAFPLPVEDLQCRSRFESGYGGMTLRDYLAAKAMAALIAEPVNEGWPSSVMHWTSQLQMRTQMSGPDIVVARRLHDGRRHAQGSGGER